nr:ATP-binding protein [Polymorphobacter sp.]
MLGDPVRAASLARSAGEIAAGWPQGDARDIAVATSQWLEGEAAFRTDDVSRAQSRILLAMHTVERVAPGSKLQADLLLSRARIAVEQSKPQAGLTDLQQAYGMFARLGDARNEAKALQSIGSIYQDAQDFSHVLYYYRLAREAFPSDPTLGLSASNNMANAYAQTGRPDAAMQEYEHALELARQLDSPLLSARILENIADLQIIDKKFGAARSTIKQGLALTSDPKASAERPTLLGTQARLELAEGDAGAALRAIEAAFAISGNVTTDQAYRPVHLTAYRAYKLTGNYQRALEHLEAFRALDDAGRTLATSTSSALMAARFDFANQNARIARFKTTQLQTAVTLAQLKARQRTLLLAGLLVLVAGAALFLIIYLRALRRSRNEILEANRRLAQTNTELAEALLAKSQFLATTSHEIRTPLNGILGMTQVMLADQTVTGGVRERLGLVNSAGRAMRTLVDDILDFAKMDSGALAIEAGTVDIAATLPDLVALWRAEALDKGITLDLDIDETLVPIVTDTVRLRQIVFNLLSNAIKFTTEGSVRVTAAPVTGDASEQVEIAFHDTGVGIPAGAFETIFEPFRQLDTSTTRRFGGTGLGLAISRHLARALGGDITVDSIPGEGSTFRLSVPYKRAVATEPRISADADRANRARPHLLIVGANPIGRSMLRTRLDPHFDRCAAYDLAEAVERVDRDAPDIVLIDAEGLDDNGLTDLLDEFAAMPVAVAVLGPAELAGRAAVVRDHGAAAVIVKPISIDGLVAELAALPQVALLPC